MNVYLALTFLPLIGVNIWHGMLIILHGSANRPHSISEHAAARKNLLLGQRIAHIGASVILVFFATTYLLPRGYTLEASLLILGAIFDVLEVITLNKASASRWNITEPHQITTWLMAAFYLSYGVVICMTAEFSPWISNTVWALFVLLLAWAIRNRFTNFWIMQMLYFVLLALVICAAHVKLLGVH